MPIPPNQGRDPGRVDPEPGIIRDNFMAPVRRLVDRYWPTAGARRARAFERVQDAILGFLITSLVLVSGREGDWYTANVYLRRLSRRAARSGDVDGFTKASERLLSGEHPMSLRGACCAQPKLHFECKG